MPQWTRIVITQCWPVYQEGDTWVDEPPPPCDTPSKRRVRIRACFEERRGQSQISQKLAGRLLPKSPQVKYVGIRYSHVVDRTVGTSRLQISGGLRCDAVIYESYDCSSKLLFQQCSTWVRVNRKDSERGTEESSNQSTSGRECSPAASERTPSHTSPSTSEIDQLSSSTTSQASELLALAGSNGFLITNPSSLAAFASLFYLAQSDKNVSDTLERPRSDNSNSQQDSQVGTNSSGWSSIHTPRTLDLGQSGWEQISSSAGTMKGSQDEQSAASARNNQPMKELSARFQADPKFQVTTKCSHSDSATSDWLEVGTPKSNSSGEPREVDTRERGEIGRNEEEIEALSDSLLEQHSSLARSQSLADFENHPGHKVWEWDVERQRWHKKGGTTEDDWFPEVLS